MSADQPPTAKPAPQPLSLGYAAPPPGRSFEWRPWLRFAAVLAAVYVVEVAAAILAYYTVGELVSMFLLIVATVAALVTLFVASFHRRTAAVVLLIAALLIVPDQAHLGLKWLRLARESERVIAHLEAHRQASGAYPANLTGYAFRDAALAASINYSQEGGGASFSLWYSIGSPNTAHSYTPAGSWFYYPD